MTGLPLSIDVVGRRVVVVGAGGVAAAKVTSLLEAGADVEIVAPTVGDAVAGLARDGSVRVTPRAWEPPDLDGAWLVVAATASAEVNAAVVAAAEDRGTWCVRVDDGAASPAALLGALRRGPLLLAVSTSGMAPALTARIRRELADRYGAEWGELAALMGELRADPDVRARLAPLPATERRRRWHALVSPDIVDLLRSGRRNEAKEVAAACLCSSSD